MSPASTRFTRRWLWRWSGPCVIACAIGIAAVPGRAASLCQRATAAPSNATVPVATADGIDEVPQEQYAERMRTLGYLPEMTREYVFGRKIPYPATDRLGHVRVDGSDTELTPGSEQTSAVGIAPPAAAKPEPKLRPHHARGPVSKKDAIPGAELKPIGSD